MRDYRDAKTMAKALRRGLLAHGHDCTHSQSLELIAQAFGFDNWNVLAARIEATNLKAAADAGPDATRYCGFCGKSQHDVRVLIAGPNSLICNECVALSDDIVEDQAVLGPIRKDPAASAYPAVDDYLAGRSDGQLEGYLSRAEKLLADETEALAKLDADPDALPEFVKNKAGPARAQERATLQRRLREQIALRRRSIDIVCAELAARR